MIAVNSINKNYSSLIRRSLMKQPKIASAIKQGSNEIEKSIKELSVINKPRTLTSRFQTPILSTESIYKVMSLYDTDPKKADLIGEVYKNMFFCDTQAPIKVETINDFIDELINLKDTTTLEKALESKVKIIISLSDNVASYSNSDKIILLFQNSKGENNVSSLPHELGHAFDQNNPINENSSLHRGLIPKLVKNNDGSYKVTGLLPNAKKITIGISEEGKFEKQYKDIISDYASTSEEFKEALKKDFDGMISIEKRNNLKKGIIFSMLTKDWSKGSLFAYYLGVKDIDENQIEKYLMQREMFAQMCALITAGHTTAPIFDEIAPKFFPNTYKFVNDFIKKN